MPPRQRSAAGLMAALADAYERGWQPADVMHVTRRALGAGAAPTAAAAVLFQARTSAPPGGHRASGGRSSPGSRTPNPTRPGSPRSCRPAATPTTSPRPSTPSAGRSGCATGST
ncbi:hypothetical protein P9209_26075 [Prescottella defluvii]|nr:hypothetical protein P9209_26075 [Prescottella defluvii]